MVIEYLRVISSFILTHHFLAFPIFTTDLLGSDVGFIVGVRVSGGAELGCEF
jgi:hypothetical protein